MLDISDFSQELEVRILIQHIEEDTIDEDAHPDLYLLGGSATPTAGTETDDGGIKVTQADDASDPAKRKRSDSGDSSAPAKRAAASDDIEVL